MFPQGLLSIGLFGTKERDDPFPKQALGFEEMRIGSV
jgi:hypothetical protein